MNLIEYFMFSVRVYSYKFIPYNYISPICIFHNVLTFKSLQGLLAINDRGKM